MQKTLVDSVSRMNDSHVQLREELNIKYDNLHSVFADCNKRLSDHDTLLAAHSDAISDINAKLLRIENNMKVSAGDNPANNAGSPNFLRDIADTGDLHTNIDDIILEFDERQRRASNVMLFGVPEDQSLNTVERKQADTDYVTRLFSHVGINPDVSDVSRVGTVAAGKRRPVRVVLRKKEMVRDVLNRAKRLRQSQDYKNVYISSDQTPRQQKLYRKVKNQLTERIAGGEQNLKIRYVSGRPTIVNLN